MIQKYSPIVSLLAACIIIGKPALADEAITLDKTTYFLAYNEVADEGSLKEFLPEGQTLQKWTEMLAIRRFKNIDSPKQYIVNMAKSYQTNYPHMDYALMTNESETVWLVDFIAYDESKETKVIEWNFFRAQKDLNGNGIVVDQYALRRYFRGSVAKLREEWNIPEIRRNKLPILIETEFVVRDVKRKKSSDESR